MERIRLANCSVFKAPESLYIKQGDDSLMHLQGKELAQITAVVEATDGQELEADNLYALVADDFDNDREFFDAILEWLVVNKILERTKGKREHAGPYRVAFFTGESYCDKMGENLKKAFDNEPEWKIDTYPLAEDFSGPKPDLILVFSPLFDDYKKIRELDLWAYREDVPLLHLGVSSMSVTVGPLVMPSKRSPSLTCYAKRKLANTADASKYIEFLRQSEKQTVKRYDFSDFPFFGMMMEMAKNEVKRFLAYEGQYSGHITGKSVTMDFSDYGVETSRVLRVPGSEVYNQARNNPFNS
ncbi:hypothetical protein FUAX_47320 (plasmid) [Fulvitalea axinellae]|uniref:Uncharacterized protein n=1 Tax=Fulvitalea axinellae TaxID=1182444 RepID=A0AAU9DIA1_9BACT|nr:hypothetical protein FUAX_47320 [Fulvitalea axinellae]